MTHHRSAIPTGSNVPPVILQCLVEKAVVNQKNYWFGLSNLGEQHDQAYQYLHFLS